MWQRMRNAMGERGEDDWGMGGDEGAGVDEVLGLFRVKEDNDRGGGGEGISAMDTIDRLHR